VERAFDAMLAYKPHHKVAIGDIAFIEGHRPRQVSPHTCRKVIEHDDLGSCIQECIHSVTADVAGSAGD
jgi:hypothetical protein